jgi:hypothetical protein
MNAKKAKTIRRLCGDDKKSARRVRHDYARAPTSKAQQSKRLGAGPSVPVGRPGSGAPIRTAPQDKPLRAIFSIAKELKVKARELVRPFVAYDCRDPIKHLAHGPRARVNAVLQQLRAA